VLPLYAAMVLPDRAAMDRDRARPTQYHRGTLVQLSSPDPPDPAHVRRTLQDALTRSPDDVAAAFDDSSGARWLDRSLARCPCASWVHPVDRWAWQRARERLASTPPAITALDIVACPVWRREAENDRSSDWLLALCVLATTPTLTPFLAEPAPAPLPIVAHARVSVADVASLVLARDYAAGVPGIERFDPFAVLQRQVLRVDAVRKAVIVRLTPAPARTVEPWASDVAFPRDALEAKEREAVEQFLATQRIQPERGFDE
jgi:hypothetical protein